MEPQNTFGLLERFNAWIQESIMIKLVSIGFLTIILLIPSAWIENLIYERQKRAGDVIDEVADKWSGAQTISGPILVIPYKRLEVIDLGRDGTETKEYEEKAFFLPDQLDVNGNITPEILHRGIFDAVVYRSELQIGSVFSKPDFKSLSVQENMVMWDKAYLAFGIADVRGIQDSLTVSVAGKALESEPSNNIGVTVSTGAGRDQHDDLPVAGGAMRSSTGITTKLSWSTAEDFSGMVDITLGLKGSEKLYFTPVGKTSSVQLTSDWPDPSFNGEFLPYDREITEDGFKASWKVLHFNRPFSQQWTNNNQVLSGASFGVELLIPVDQYQKSMRTAKYGILIVLLTFMALFLVEITHKIRIHPFQYILIGAALIIYYSLLLSFSEHIGYNLAYLLSSVATVALIGSYSRTFFPHARFSVLFGALLMIFYLFVYVIIQQQDFSLLIGSVGLFVMVGTLMYFSRRVRWYSEKHATGSAG